VAASEVERYERLLSEHLRRFLIAHEEGNLDERIEQLGEACSFLGAILQNQLERSNRWPSGAWVDDVVTTSEHVLPTGELELQGFVIWAHANGYPDEWVEPFAGSMLISPQTDRILRYTLKCGDDTRGLQTRLYPADAGPLPQKWIFEFSTAPERATEVARSIVL
jgi:hypothetical protein